MVNYILCDFYLNKKLKAQVGKKYQELVVYKLIQTRCYKINSTLLFLNKNVRNTKGDIWVNSGITAKSYFKITVQCNMHLNTLKLIQH